MRGRNKFYVRAADIPQMQEKLAQRGYIEGAPRREIARSGTDFAVLAINAMQRAADKENRTASVFAAYTGFFPEMPAHAGDAHAGIAPAITLFRFAVRSAAARAKKAFAHFAS